MKSSAARRNTMVSRNCYCIKETMQVNIDEGTNTPRKMVFKFGFSSFFFLLSRFSFFFVISLALNGVSHKR